MLCVLHDLSQVFKTTMGMRQETIICFQEGHKRLRFNANLHNLDSIHSNTCLEI